MDTFSDYISGRKVKDHALPFSKTKFEFRGTIRCTVHKHLCIRALVERKPGLELKSLNTMICHTPKDALALCTYSPRTSTIITLFFPWFNEKCQH